MAPVPYVIEPQVKFITQKNQNQNETISPKTVIVWKNVILIGLIHLGALYGAYLMIVSAKYQTVFAWYLFCLLSGMGVTAGAHRLWAHRSYRANFALRALLCFLNTMAVQNDLYDWCRDHRVHHKYSETDADPHNANRGFFFSHIGWLLCKKHPDVIEKGKTVDLSDLLADPLIRFQRKYYRPLVVIIAIVIPTLIPMYFWSESAFNSFFICVVFRYCYILNSTWLVNSAAHMWGQKPYDLTINPRENSFVTLQSYGEGYHNYHHTFPWDYSASELDWKYNWNFSTLFIDFFAKIGWAYDRKRVSPTMIEARVRRTGDKPLIKEFEKISFAKLFTMRCFTLLIALSHLWIPFSIRFLIRF